jgi:DNA helicase II / ATP-dependent DNA helicase PcrA
MDMSITQINSDTLIPIEQHFRVSAGPGAGKTYWLINHIKNVLHQSDRLGKTRKIACITYTNVAVETILGRLGTSAHQIEVSTIHSFLYRHLVKPYAKFIADEYGLNVQEMDGHDDIVLSNYSFLKEWKEKTQQKRITEDNKLFEAFSNAKWKFNDSKSLVIKPNFPHKANGYSIKNNSYFEYKKLAWEKGIVHHDDVLFFSHQLIQKFPFVLQVLRAKFPYFFVDEFQDTNPIQVKILSQVGLEETIVGVIGDVAQSIYGFQGAEPSQFSSFTLPNIIDFQMADNRRSSNQIVDVLNNIRFDISQNKFKNEEGEKPTVIVGDMCEALCKVRELCGNEDIYSLSRNNITSNAMKRDMNQDIPSNDLLQSLYNTDSNNDRRKLILACIKATELAREKRFKEAIKEFERVFRNKDGKGNGRKEALKNICLFLQKYNDFKDKSLCEFHSIVKSEINIDIAKLSKGAPKTFYETHTYQQLAVCVKITEDTSLHRTIHKAKGAEFDNVLLVLKDEGDLAFLT